MTWHLIRANNGLKEQGNNVATAGLQVLRFFCYICTMDKELDWEYASKVQKEALDQIDFLPYIEKYKGKKFWDMLYAVEDDYDNTEVSRQTQIERSVI